MRTISNIFGHSLPEIVTPSDNFVLPLCNIGVEIELERFIFNSRPYLSLIEIINDHSLRNSGRELVFKRPLRGVNLESGIEELSGILDSTNYDKSWRCSTHIHLDVRDMTVDEYKNLVFVSSIVEPTLFKMEPTRVDNPYCIPYDKLTNSNTVASVFNSLFDNRFRDLEYFPKYSSINLGATYKYGSIEYRTFEAIDDMTKLIKYINMIMLAKKIAINHIEITPELVYGIYKKSLGITLSEDTDSYESLMSIKNTINIGTLDLHNTSPDIFLDDFEEAESGEDNNYDDLDEPLGASNYNNNSIINIAIEAGVPTYLDSEGYSYIEYNNTRLYARPYNLRDINPSAIRALGIGTNIESSSGSTYTVVDYDGYKLITDNETY